jgi:hypothetical protein
MATSIETDEGEPLKGKCAAAALIEDWDLQLDAKRPTTADHKPRQQGKKPKLAHKMVFSMPAGTPPQNVLAAVKGFAREEFGAKHRYAMVLHTDEPHPHVHVVVKAMGYDGKRLNPRKATLREWRRQFARHLREHSVAANATDRAVRGVNRPQKTDGIHRAALRGASTHWHRRTASVARDLAYGGLTAEAGNARLTKTREEVVRGWHAIAADLDDLSHRDIAAAVRGFANALPPVKTEREWIADQLRGRATGRKERARTDQDERTR